MVVDDQEDITRFLIKSLNNHYPEIEATGFSNSKAALDWLETNSPDIIITDLRMPEYGGAEIIASAIAKNPHIPIIVMSALPSLEEFKIQSTPAESVHYLPKPFMFQDLKELLERITKAAPESIIHGFRPISLLQVIHLENKSCRVDLSDNGQAGTLIFQNGDLIRAEAGELRGEIALFELLGFRNPTITLFKKPSRCEFNIEKPLPELLLNYCRQTDEKSLR
jgi:DNA-binding response OmpR family regulator